MMSEQPIKPTYPQGSLYTTDLRVTCTFSDGSERDLLLINGAKRLPSGQVVWDRQKAETQAHVMARRFGWDVPAAIRMELVKGAC